MEANWRLLAKCKGSTKTFYSEKPVDIVVAKSKCKICPVQKACLGEALLTREDDGTWGGMTERERRKLGRKFGNLQVFAESTTASAGDGL